VVSPFVDVWVPGGFVWEGGHRVWHAGHNDHRRR
jgi:hypothetical protein